MRARRTALFLTAAPLLALAACGGGSDDSAADTTAAPTGSTGTVTTLEQSTTITSLPETTVATETTVAGVPGPLTGLPITDPAIAQRPAMAVKMDNHTDARPHAGLNQADIVYEEIVEGITRFFVIFHSTDAAPIGPIRSARTTDVDLLNQLNRPFLVWSGGNAKVVAAIDKANAESRAHGQAPGFYRDEERRARAASEHTLLNEGTAGIWATATPEQLPPSPLFTYGTPSAGDPVSVISMKMNSVPVEWMWDAAGKVFVRAEYGDPHTDTTGAPITSENVVVQFVDYKTSAADPRSPEAVTVGSGDALVYTNGEVVLAKWDRPEASKPAAFTGADGDPIVLTPGRTWIELAEAGVTKVTAT